MSPLWIEVVSIKFLRQVVLSLDLLHKFQRILFTYTYQSKTDNDLSGAEALLDSYIQQVVTACVTTLNKAHETRAKKATRNFSDSRFPSLRTPHRATRTNTSSAIEGEVHDSDDMEWLCIICGSTVKSPRAGGNPHPPLVHREPLHRRRQLSHHQRLRVRRRRLSTQILCHAGNSPIHPKSATRNPASRSSSSPFLRVGRFAINEIWDKDNAPRQMTTLTHFHSECMLAYLLGLRSNILKPASPLQAPVQEPAQLYHP
uniref:Probable E3 ubiquitin-protein ligase HERC2 n=1 Tax=Culex pipiens TaxID=7175 RepID=A0A8D8C1Y1_CULPI